MKKQQDEIEKILNEQKREQLLKDNSTIEKLEFLLKPLTSHLNEKKFKVIVVLHQYMVHQYVMNWKKNIRMN